MSRRGQRALVAFAAAMGVSGVVHGQTVVSKAANTDQLQLGSSWTGGVAPTASTIAQWAVAANTSALGADVSWAGLRLTSASGAVTINPISVSITADPATSTFTATANPFVNGNLVRFTATTAPTGLAAGTYYVVNATATTFQLSDTLGGAAKSFTDAGATLTAAGTFTVSIGTSGIDLSAAVSNLTINTPVALAGSQVWNVAAGRVVTISSSVAFNQGTNNLTLNGLGTVTFATPIIAGQGTGTGTLTLNGGVLTVLAPTTSNFPGQTNVLSPGTTLAVNGGIVNLNVGNNVGTFTQNFAGLTVGAGATQFFQARGSSSLVVVNFGNITRVLGGTANLTPTTNNSGFRTTTANTNGIIGGYLTFNSTDFVRSTASTANLLAATYTNDAWAAANNTTVTTSSAVTGATTNSLRFGAASAQTLTLSGTNTITSGGLLVSSGVGAFNNVITGGTLVGAAGADLIIHQFNTAGSLTIASAIANNSTATALTKSGDGLLVLSGDNSFSGGVFLNAGTVQLASAGALNSSGANAVAFANNSSARLQLNGNSATVAGLRTATTVAATAPIVENASATSAVLTVATAGSDTFAGTLQNGTGAGTLGLVKNGTGTLTLSGTTTYTGNTTVNAGTLALTGSSGPSAGVLSLAAGSTLNVTGRTGGGFLVANGQTLTGAGTVVGGLSTTTGSIIAPGSSGIGVLTASTLSLAQNSILNFELSGSTSDLIRVTGTNGLTLLGGGFNLYAAGTTDKFATPGVYNLLEFSGTIQGTGVSALTAASILNPQGGATYSFGVSGNFVQLTIAGSAALVSNWNVDASGSWASSANWSAGIPGASGETARFASAITANRTVSLNGDRTVGAVEFLSNIASYLIDPGSGGRLLLDNGTGTAVINDLGGSHTISAPITLVSPTSVTVSNAADTLTLSGLIADGSTSRGLTKLGNGTLNLTGLANTYTGTTLVSGGTLQFAGAGSLGTGGIALAGGTLKWAAGSTADLSTRAITFGAGGATFDTNGNNIVFTEPFGNNGAGGFTKTGAGSLTVFDGSFAGPTTIVAGTLIVSSDTALGAAPATAATSLTFDPGAGNSSTLQLAAPIGLGATRNIVLNSGNAIIDTGANTATVSGALSGTGNLTKNGTGTLVLNGTSTATGATTLNEGTLNVTSAANLPTGTLTLNNSATLIANAATTFNPVVNGTNTINMAGNASAGRILSIGNLSGAGTLTLNNAYVTDLTGSLANFTGTVVLSTGSFRWNGSSGGNNLTLDTGNTGISVRAAATTAVAIGALQGNGGLFGSGGGATQAVTYTVGAKNINTTYAGSIQNGAGTTSFVKTGTGTLTLTGASTYTGGTTINGGTLQLSGAGSIASSATLNVAAGGTLDVAGASAFSIGTGQSLLGAGTLTGNAAFAGGSFSAGTVGTAGTFTVTGNVLATAASTLTFDIASATLADALKIGGVFNADNFTLNITKGTGLALAEGVYTFSLFQNATGGAQSLVGRFTEITTPTDGTLQWNLSSLYVDGTISVTSAIPEPATFAVLAGMLALGAGLGRRRRRVAA